MHLSSERNMYKSTVCGMPCVSGRPGARPPPLNRGSQHDAIRSSSSSACRILIDTCICCPRPGCSKAAAALDAAFWAPSALIDRKAAVCWSVCLSVCQSVCLPPCLPVCLSVWLSVCMPPCLSACLLDTTVSPAKTDDPIEMPVGAWTRTGARNHTLGGILYPQRKRKF